DPSVRTPGGTLRRPQPRPAAFAFGCRFGNRARARRQPGLAGHRRHGRCPDRPRRRRSVANGTRMIYLEATVGTHPTVSFCSSWFCTLDVDSLVSSGIAILITLAVGFFIAYRVSHGVPGKLQLVLEFLLNYARDQVNLL